jgi:hypothetical protein
MRAVRLGMTIRRIGSYSCAIVFDRELRTEIGIEVAPDRTLEMYARTEEPSAPAEETTEEPAAEQAEAKPAKGKAKADGDEGGVATKSARTRKA